MVSWYNEDWLYRKKVTVDNTKVNAGEAHFPVFFDKTDTDIKDAARSDGFDILFTEDDGETLLDFELIHYNSSTGQVQAYVSTATDSGTDTYFYIYYGNPGHSVSLEDVPSTWTSCGYNHVWHLDDAGSPYLDAVGTAPNLITGGAPTPTQTGMGDGGYSVLFNGTTDFLQTDTAMVLFADTTIEMWVKANATQVQNEATLFSTNTDHVLRLMARNTGTDAALFDTGSASSSWEGAVSSAIDVTDNIWHLIGMTVDPSGNSRTIQIDDNTITTNTDPCNFYYGPTPLLRRIGDGLNAPESYYTGYIDEIRISDEIRTSAWFDDCYNTITDSAFLKTLGAEEDYVLVLTDISSPQDTGPYTITWDAAHVEHIDIHYYTGSWAVMYEDIDATLETYTINFSTDESGANRKVKITDSDDAARTSETSAFTITTVGQVMPEMYDGYLYFLDQTAYLPTSAGSMVSFTITEEVNRAPKATVDVMLTDANHAGYFYSGNKIILMIKSINGPAPAYITKFIGKIVTVTANGIHIRFEALWEGFVLRDNYITKTFSKHTVLGAVAEIVEATGATEDDIYDALGLERDSDSYISSIEFDDATAMDAINQLCMLFGYQWLISWEGNYGIIRMREIPFDPSGRTATESFTPATLGYEIRKWGDDGTSVYSSVSTTTSTVTNDEVEENFWKRDLRIGDDNMKKLYNLRWGQQLTNDTADETTLLRFLSNLHSKRAISTEIVFDDYLEVHPLDVITLSTFQLGIVNRSFFAYDVATTWAARRMSVFIHLGSSITKVVAL